MLPERRSLTCSSLPELLPCAPSACTLTPKSISAMSTDAHTDGLLLGLAPSWAGGLDVQSGALPSRHVPGRGLWESPSPPSPGSPWTGWVLPWSSRRAGALSCWKQPIHSPPAQGSALSRQVGWVGGPPTGDSTQTNEKGIFPGSSSAPTPSSHSNSLRALCSHSQHVQTCVSPTGSRTQ